MGYKKINFNLEEYTSASRLKTIERSVASRYFSESNNGRRLGLGGRHSGFFWSGNIEQIEGLSYGLSITNSFSDNPISIPENAGNGLLYACNVVYERDIFDGVCAMFGFNFAYTNESNVAGSKAFRTGSILGVNPYLKLTAHNLEIFGEFLLARLENGRQNYSASTTPMGLNIGFEYKFDIGEFGAIAPVFRYSFLDTNGRGAQMSDGVRNAISASTFDRAHSLYFGLNWYIAGDSLKFQLGYEWARLDGSHNVTVAQKSEANAVRAQIQVLF